MNTHDDDQPDLQDMFLHALGGEPVMASLPEDDLARGKRLVRRHRAVAVAAIAVTVPAVALGGWSVSGSLGSQSGSGLTQIQPADGSSEPTPPASGCALVNLPGGGVTGSVRIAPGAHGQTVVGRSNDGHASQRQGKPVGSVRGLQSSGRETLSIESTTAPANGQPQSYQSTNCEVTASDGGDGSMTSDCVSAPATTENSAQCEAMPGGVDDSPELDRLTSLLQNTLDPAGTHSVDALSVAGTVESDGQRSGAYVSTGWSEGEHQGSVNLSVEDSATGGPASDCQDHSLPDGPTVTCTEQTLPGGGAVLVGHGEQDGVERVTVRFDRPDGTVVIATADEATDQWWTDGTGAPPLASPPVTVDQLIGLVQDPGCQL